MTFFEELAYLDVDGADCLYFAEMFGRPFYNREWGSIKRESSEGTSPSTAQ